MILKSNRHEAIVMLEVYENKEVVKDKSLFRLYDAKLVKDLIKLQLTVS